MLWVGLRKLRVGDLLYLRHLSLSPPMPGLSGALTPSAAATCSQQGSNAKTMNGAGRPCSACSKAASSTTSTTSSQQVCVPELKRKTGQLVSRLTLNLVDAPPPPPGQDGGGGGGAQQSNEGEDGMDAATRSAQCLSANSDNGSFCSATRTDWPWADWWVAGRWDRAFIELEKRLAQQQQQGQTRA